MFHSWFGSDARKMLRLIIAQNNEILARLGQTAADRAKINQIYDIEVNDIKKIDEALKPQSKGKK